MRILFKNESMSLAIEQEDEMIKITREDDHGQYIVLDPDTAEIIVDLCVAMSSGDTTYSVEFHGPYTNTSDDVCLSVASIPRYAILDLSFLSIELENTSAKILQLLVRHVIDTMHASEPERVFDAYQDPAPLRRPVSGACKGTAFGEVEQEDT